MTTGPDTESGNGLWTISSSGASSITHLCIANYRLQGDYQHNNLFYNYLLSPITKCALHVHTLQNCRYLDVFSVFIHLLCSTIKTKYNVHVCVVSEKHNFNINTEQLNIGHLRTTRLFRDVVISLLGKCKYWRTAPRSNKGSLLGKNPIQCRGKIEMLTHSWLGGIIRL